MLNIAVRALTVWCKRKITLQKKKTNKRRDFLCVLAFLFLFCFVLFCFALLACLCFVFRFCFVFVYGFGLVLAFVCCFVFCFVLVCLVLFFEGEGEEHSPLRENTTPYRKENTLSEENQCLNTIGCSLLIVILFDSVFDYMRSLSVNTKDPLYPYPSVYHIKECELQRSRCLNL